MEIKLLGNRILVKDEVAEIKTSSGLFMPEDTSARTIKGTVCFIGTGTEDDPIVVKIGETILYEKISGFDIKLNGEKYRLLRMSDVIAIF